MHILICDTETSGLDPKTDHLLEVGIAVYSLEHRAVTKARAFLVQAPALQVTSALQVNGIPLPLVLDESAASREQADAAVTAWARGCAAVLAHSADFDRGWFGPAVQALPWADTMEFRWPAFSTSQSLVALALAHGLGVGSAHRALEDVLLLSRLLTRAAELGMHLEEEVQRGLRPRGRFVVAETGYDPARNELAKQHHFRWDQEKRVWWRSMAVDDTKELPFAVREVAEGGRR